MKSAPDLGDGASWLLLYGVQIREQARDRGELVHAVIWRNMCFHTLFAGAGQLFSALCFISIFKCTELSRTDFYTIPCQINSVTPSPVTSPQVPDVFTSDDFINVLLYLLFKTVIIKKKSGSICNICCIKHKEWSWNPSGSDIVPVKVMYLCYNQFIVTKIRHFKEFICFIELSISLWFFPVNYFLHSSAACGVRSHSRNWRSVITASSWWIVPTINQPHAKLVAILCACL